MKLKKSIEKAKQQREEAAQKTTEETALSEKIEKVSSDKTTPSNEWNAPVYCDSCAIDLDPDQLAKNRCVSMVPDAKESEHYKVLRTNILQRTKENNWNTIMITSVQPGEGKTLTAINLAAAFAKEYNQTVLLVDCDLRRQKIHEYLNFSNEKGIVDYLVNNCELKDLIVWPNIEKLTLISGGKTIANSAELLGSPRMKSLVNEIKCRYDDRYVIFDVPPILGGADAIAFAPLVDCILMVVEEGRTSIKDVNKALEMIPAEKFMGYVLNRRKTPVQGYYY
ncbi:MAG: polysaccharide biosynthesis tyrosine autokinase [Deltaproteobacteria bacterium]|nr:polysaccharide biosynthesis tyrosine autokinase [Deltaproteobacteria bacterium]MBW2323416.1 polysaccharide biosynthesis tyrosine autokinase [Deltaproteobacteria bacterium]